MQQKKKKYMAVVSSYRILISEEKTFPSGLLNRELAEIRIHIQPGRQMLRIKQGETIIQLTILSLLLFQLRNITVIWKVLLILTLILRMKNFMNLRSGRCQSIFFLRQEIIIWSF